jgi:hypothetical protein
MVLTFLLAKELAKLERAEVHEVAVHPSREFVVTL